MEKFYSQYKQDYFVDFILQKQKGVFLDIGANDGVSFSNSYYFEKEKGWTGICIEPIKETFAKLQKVRSCICLNEGVWSEKKTLRFYRAHGYAEMLSGIVDSFNDDHFKRMKADIERSGGTLETLEIEVDSLNNILNRYQITHIDFCSIDTEGSEYEILKALDYNKYRIMMMAAENQYNENILRRLMNERNYTLVWRQGGDDFFIHNSLYSKGAIRYRIRLFFIREFFLRRKKQLLSLFKKNK